MGRQNEVVGDSQAAAPELGPEQASCHGLLSVHAMVAVAHLRGFLMERKVGDCRSPDEGSSCPARAHRLQLGGNEEAVH